MECRNIIYIAYDPVTNEIRYVGQTRKGLKNRERRHKYEANRLKDHAHHWMKSLLKKNLWPRFEVLEEFQDIEGIQKILDDAEIDYIARFKAMGHPLTNTTPGGQGVGFGQNHPFYGKHHTVEAIEKIREASHNQIWTDERKKNISKSLTGDKNYWYDKEGPFKGKHHSESTKEKISQLNIGLKHPERTGDNHWTHKQNRGPNTGKKMTQEWKANMIASLKGRKLSDKEIECRSKKVICLNDNTEYSSQKEASFAKGISSLTVSRCCRDGKERSGFRFVFVEKV